MQRAGGVKRMQDTLPRPYTSRPWRGNPLAPAGRQSKHGTSASASSLSGDSVRPGCLFAEYHTGRTFISLANAGESLPTIKKKGGKVRSS